MRLRLPSAGPSILVLLFVAFVLFLLSLAVQAQTCRCACDVTTTALTTAVSNLQTSVDSIGDWSSVDTELGYTALLLVLISWFIGLCFGAAGGLIRRFITAVPTTPYRA